MCLLCLRHQVRFDHRRNQSYKGNWLEGMETIFFFFSYVFEIVIWQIILASWKLGGMLRKWSRSTSEREAEMAD